MTATRDEPKPIEAPVARSSRVEWPEASPRRETTLGTMLLIAASFGGAMLLDHFVPARADALLLGLCGFTVLGGPCYLVARHRRRRRVRAVAEATAGGLPTWEADWTERRTTLGNSVFERSVPAGTWRIPALLFAAILTFLLDDSDPVERPLLIAGWFAALNILFAVWIVLRGGAQVSF